MGRGTLGALFHSMQALESSILAPGPMGSRSQALQKQALEIVLVPHFLLGAFPVPAEPDVHASPTCSY